MHTDGKLIFQYISKKVTKKVFTSMPTCGIVTESKGETYD